MGCAAAGEGMSNPGTKGPVWFGYPRHWRPGLAGVSSFLRAMNFFSERFGLEVIVTDHALARARERAIADAELKDVIETGTAKYRESKRH